MDTLPIYILSSLGILFTGFSKLKDDRVVYFLFALISAYFISERSIIDVPDTIVYANFFKDTNPYSLDDTGNYSFEIGYQILTKFLKIITNGDVTVYFYIIALANFLIFFAALRNFQYGLKKNYVVALLVYISYYGLFYTAIVLRAGLAIAILLYVFSLLYKNHGKQNFKAILLYGCLCLIAISFHLSAIVGFVAILLYYYVKPKTSSFYAIIYLLCVVCYFSKVGLYLIDSFSSILTFLLGWLGTTDFAKYSYYSDLLSNTSVTISYRMIFLLLIGGGVTFAAAFQKDVRYHKLLVVFLLGLFVSSLFSVVEQIARITDYYLVLSTILLMIIFAKIRRFDTKVLFLSGIVFIQFYMVFRIINGV